MDDQLRQLLSRIEADPMVVHFADILRIMVSAAPSSPSGRAQMALIKPLSASTCHDMQDCIAITCTFIALQHVVYV